MVRAVQLYAWFAPGKQQVIWLSAIGSSVYNVQVVGKALLVSGEMSSLFQLLSISLRNPWDYGDYTDYANESVSAYWTQIHEPDPPPTGSSLQHLSEAGDLLTEREDIQGTQDHRIDYAIRVINRNQRNQSDLPCLQATLRVEHNEGEMAVDLNASSPGKARASPFVQSKKRCPHHPHARWIRFDPSGQAWWDRMDCWDCYRLMKIGEAPDYRPLSKYTRGIVTVEQGIEAWSSFVTSQGSFAVLTATQYAIDLCKALGVEVPDLSGEVKRLVSAWE